MNMMCMRGQAGRQGGKKRKKKNLRIIYKYKK